MMISTTTQLKTMACKTTTFFNILLALFHLLPTINLSELSYEVLPYIRVYKNGTVERLIGTEVVPASVDSKTGVQSKDVDIPSVISQVHGNIISARLFLPKNVGSRHDKVPLLVYFHGEGFFTQSAFAPDYHNYMNSLVAAANVVALSVNYRLAPENPLPIGYEDSWNAFTWVVSQCNESWIKEYVDFEHVYLGGDSSGGNIAHNLAIRVGIELLNRVKIAGLFLDCPYFWGMRRIGNESSDPDVAIKDNIWIHAYPNSTGFDDPLVNPGMDPKLKKLGSKRVLVYVAEIDILKYRGFYYAWVLRKSGWHGDVEVVEVMGERHIFNIASPNKPKSLIMLKQLACFLNGGKVNQSRISLFHQTALYATGYHS